jgi:hypothetical protein
MISREHLFIFTLNKLTKIRIVKRGYFFTLNYLPNKPRKIIFDKNSRYGLTKKIIPDMENILMWQRGSMYRKGSMYQKREPRAIKSTHLHLISMYHLLH